MNATETKVILTVNGKTLTAWLANDAGGTSVTFDGDTYQNIPTDRADYRYTNGGAAYRTACETAWELFGC